MDRHQKQRLAQCVGLMGCALGVGFALGTYLAGEIRLVLWGALLASIAAVSTFFLSLYSARTKPHWDPLSPFAGVRIVFMSTALLFGGLSIGGGLGNFINFMDTHRPFPASSMMQIGLAGLFICHGLWWLSWPADDLNYGKYRFMGWLQIGTAGVMTFLQLAIRFTA